MSVIAEASPPAPGVRKNVLANLAGKVWGGALSLLLIRLYVRLLGIESYGLIGFYTTLTIVVAVLDMGLGATLVRELARLSARDEARGDARDFVRTFEVLYWGIGFLVSLGVIALAPWIARHWVQARGLPIAVVQQSVTMMGIIIAFQWPVALYTGGLMGLQRQVLMNGVNTAFLTVQSAGAVLVLLFVSATVQAYFVWQVIVSAAQVLALALCLWRSLPEAASRPSIRFVLWKNSRRFAAGITGVTLLGTLLAQMDKLVVSKLLPLEALGYYMLATTISSALTYLTSPFFMALFPRFSQLIAEQKEAELSRLYHRSCQMLSVILMPVWITVALFSRELLSLWVGKPGAAEHTHLTLSLYVTGTLLNSLVVLPYALQLAYGWTSLAFYQNVVSVVILAPLLVFMTARFGPAGAALVWIILNACYIGIQMPIMHRRLLRGELKQWYTTDIGLPLAICAAIGLSVRYLLPQNAPVVVMAAAVLFVPAAAAFASAAALPATRASLLRRAWHRTPA